MADKEDLDFTYTTIDKIFRLSIGESADYSGAKYDGDFSMSLEEAQKAIAIITIKSQTNLLFHRWTCRRWPTQQILVEIDSCESHFKFEENFIWCKQGGT